MASTFFEWSAIYRPILAYLGTVRRSLRSGCVLSDAPTISRADAPYRLFQGRPLYPNSNFVDEPSASFPQMDVWLRCRVNREKRPQAVRKPNLCSFCAEGIFPTKCRGISVSP